MGMSITFRGRKGKKLIGVRFKTGLVLSEQPPVGEVDGKSLTDQYWGLYGGKPDVLGQDLEDVIDQILNA